MGASGQSRGEQALADLMTAAKLAPSDVLPDLVARAAATFGASHTELLLVDHAQRLLVPMRPGARAGEPLSLEGTLAGLAFRRVRIQEVAQGGRRQLWIPVLDSTDRLGVLGLRIPGEDRLARTRAANLADAVGNLLHVKSLTGDAVRRVARRRPMSLAAEMQWSLMPPLTAATERAVVAAMLEPAYEVGGDVVDYALGADRVHIAVFDPMGHDLSASVLAGLAVGAYRNARRAGEDLPAMGGAIERAVSEQFAEERFTTAILATLDVATGRLRWVNAGHPPALVLRAGRLVRTLSGPTAPPLGAGLRPELPVHEETLEPGDRVLFYTDGVVEARNAAGEQFGLERLVEFVTRAEADGDLAPETMRRLSHAVLDHQGGELQDDATHLMLEWLTDEPGALQLP